ncbi:unnamed protein product [Clonostachys rhizophaga]|uniref:Zn(2)-C6 fungal-type domain-containing protein n=1 Tax=Clonostachys rhizophaga TaxID=160324 RepID=A0A9N9VJ27_9HYPO|nr:unnamed protein product [Clonostachys rhizophaga]
MGGLAAFESGQRLLPPDTPPALVSPTTTVFSSRSSPATEVAWSSRSISSPPMQDYDKNPSSSSSSTMVSEKASETSPKLADNLGAGQQKPQQQLPSLSSIFGPPPPAPRPLNSPHSDRHNSLATSSPRMDRPRHVSAGRSDSYFPPTLSPPLSHPRTSYDGSAEKPGFQGLRRSASGPGSPRFRPTNAQESRLDAEAGRGEFGRSRTMQPSQDHFRLQFTGQKEAGSGFREHGMPSSTAANPPSTANSTSQADGSSTKSTLGPKIWTGTHFLPRFVKAADVPGEGLCYFYDDGTHCKTVIDGEAVTPHWGVTKAGKPRKRLAIACVTCREKKIKCDPDYPRCIQCEKFGRVCRFKNAPRGGHNTSPSTPPAELDDVRTGGSSRRVSAEDFGRRSVSPVSPRAQYRPSSADAGSNKRLKVDQQTYVPNRDSPPSNSMPFHRSRSHIASPILTATPAMPRIPDDVLHRAWQTDPFVTDPQSIKAVVSQFFSHVDGTMVLTLLPERSTRAWVTDSTRRKLPEDLMLLYSILAVGVALSGGPKHIAFEYAQVAQYAQKGMQFNCLQLAQSRVLLGLYYVSVGRKREANELMSAAAATVASLQLNLELDNSNEASISSFPLGLNRAGYCEARRRTIWSLFMLERLSGMFPDRVTMINPEDIYIRLPCDRRSFEEQVESLAPVFNPHSLSLSKMSNHADEIATYLVMMVHLWAESQAIVYRLVHRPASAEGEFNKVRGLMGSIESWQSTLPTRLSLNRSNLEAAATEGNMGPFASMHLLYHHAMIKLNRHSRAPRQLSSEARFHHVRACQEHAADTIDMVDSIDGLFRSRTTNMSVPPPMLAIAVAEAVDVLSASQPLSLAKKVIDNIRRVRPPIDNMTNIWDDSRNIQHAIERRTYLLNRIFERGPQPVSPAEGYVLTSKPWGKSEDKELHWEFTEPLGRTFAAEMDVIYLGLH